MSKKIIFMGTPQYASIILNELIKNDYEIIALFTQADKKVGRKQIITAPHIKQYILNENISIPIFQPKTLKEENIKQTIIDLNADFIIVAAYGQILPQDILDIAPCINLHASLLPKYRGASPIQQCLLNKDKYTGVTAMMMEKGLDSGDILSFKYLKIDQTMNVEDLFNLLSTTAATLIIKVLKDYIKINPIKQNASLISYCSKIKKEDGLVELNDASHINAKYKAYKVWPGIYLKSGLKIKILKINEISSINDKNKILEINKNYIVLSCLKGSIRLFRIQVPSKKEVDATDFIRAKKLKVGDILH